MRAGSVVDEPRFAGPLRRPLPLITARVGWGWSMIGVPGRWAARGAVERPEPVIMTGIGAGCRTVIDVLGREAVVGAAARPESMITVARGRHLPVIGVSGPAAVSIAAPRPEPVIMGGGIA